MANLFTVSPEEKEYRFLEALIHPDASLLSPFLVIPQPVGCWLTWKAQQKLSFHSSLGLEDPYADLDFCFVFLV